MGIFPLAGHAAITTTASHDSSTGDHTIVLCVVCRIFIRKVGSASDGEEGHELCLGAHEHTACMPPGKRGIKDTFRRGSPSCRWLVMASYDWVISVSICVVASLISNFGLNLQKLALNMRQTASRPALVYRGVWLCGKRSPISLFLACVIVPDVVAWPRIHCAMLFRAACGGRGGQQRGRHP